jgi:hypothetical protein
MNRLTGMATFAPLAAAGTQRLAPATLGLLLILVMLAACSPFREEVQVEIGSILNSDPLVEPLPLTVGVYYGPDLIGRNEVATDYAYSNGKLRTAWDYQLALGSSSVAAFDRVFGALFERTVRLDRNPPTPSDRAGLDAVIEPRIVSAWRQTIVYEFAFATPTGEEIATWMVEGTADEQKGSDPSEQVEREVRRAVRSAMAKFMLSFEDQYGVRDWLHGRADQNRVAVGRAEEGGG